jgi:serine phosphatase RsbU (regulator of sigma subunit)
VLLVTLTLYGLFGLIIYLIRPESAPVRALSITSVVLLCIVTGFGLTQLVQPAELRWNFPINAVELMGRGWYPLLPRVGLIKDLTILFPVSLALLPPSILHFAAVFPEGNRFLTHRKALGVALYAASLLPIVGIAWALAGYRPPEAFEPLIAGLVLLGSGVAIIAALLSLLHNYRHPPHRRAKAQIQWVAMACVLPLAGALAMLIPYGFLHSLLSQWPQAGSSALGPGTLGALGLLTPLTIGYALVARRPLEAQLVVRRVICYSILMILGLEVYTLVAGGLGWVVTGSFRNPPHLIVTVSILLAASVLALTWRKLRRVIDRTLARTQYDLRKTLENFAEGLPEILDRPTLVKTLAKTMPEALKARSFYLFTADSTTGKLKLVPDLAKIPAQVQGIEFDPAEPLCQYLLKKRRPFEVEVSPYDPRLIPIFRDAAVRVSALEAAVIVGLERRRRLTGLMVLGTKEHDEFYTTEDLELLMLVAHHAAIAIETSDVFEAVAQKSELKKELEVASELQAQVLPTILPETQGCQVAARCIPAQLVSGDYYDVLELPKQKIALAIGRVSGKGVSASRAIVNLQGLLRAQAPIAENPANLVRRINRHLYSSSRGGKYCTIFYAVYDPTERRLEFVNAGQNPPVVLNRQGARLLESTGMPLGLFSEVSPEARTESLEPGAIVVLSSEGVTEARSDVGERYGMDRLIKVVRGSPDSDAGGLLERILNDVRAFTSDVPVEDDRTLVLLKVCKD